MILLCVAAVGVVAFSHVRMMERTAAMPQMLYDQPYQVGMAVRELSADVTVMHAELADLARAPSKLALRRFQRRMAEIDTRATTLRETISDRFFGDQALVRSAFDAHDAWNGVRAQVVEAIARGDQVAAYTVTKTEGYNQVKYLTERLEMLTQLSNRFSRQIYTNANEYLMASRINGAIAVFVALGMLGTAAFMVTRMVVNPVHQISLALRRIADGDLDTGIPHTGRTDEIGQIAQASQVFLGQAIAIRESATDMLTGLPTRTQLLNHIGLCRMDAGLREHPAFLMHIDIDGFVDLNDVLGRDAGDRLLQQVAHRLRTLQGPNDFIAREGADSFLWYRTMTGADVPPEEMAEQVQALLERPASIEEHKIRLECSIGIALVEERITPETLLVRADNAYIEGKRHAGRSITVYSDEMDVRLERRRETLRGLRFALQHGEIIPYFQPQVDARTGELCGFETLARWAHPEQGILPPWQFLPVAKRAGLMGAITETMISKSLAQLADWRAKGFDVPRVSLNLDGTDLGREGFADRLMLEVDRHKLEPGDVCLELLESAMIEDADDPVSRTLNRLGQLGFPIELDDFGTGHAAIASLQLIALNGVKIDRSFVTNLHERPGQLKLIKAMLRLAHALQIKTVAEGVENVHERRLLVELGCDMLQGFGIARPMSGDAAALWLESFTPAVGRMLDVRKSA